VGPKFPLGSLPSSFLEIFFLDSGFLKVVGLSCGDFYFLSLSIFIIKYYCNFYFEFSDSRLHITNKFTNKSIPINSWEIKISPFTPYGTCPTTIVPRLTHHSGRRNSRSLRLLLPSGIPKTFHPQKRLSRSHSYSHFRIILRTYPSRAFKGQLIGGQPGQLRS